MRYGKGLAVGAVAIAGAYLMTHGQVEMGVIAVLIAAVSLF